MIFDMDYIQVAYTNKWMVAWLTNVIQMGVQYKPDVYCVHFTYTHNTSYWMFKFTQSMERNENLIAHIVLDSDVIRAYFSI